MPKYLFFYFNTLLFLFFLLSPFRVLLNTILSAYITLVLSKYIRVYRADNRPFSLLFNFYVTFFMCYVAVLGREL